MTVLKDIVFGISALAGVILISLHLIGLTLNLYVKRLKTKIEYINKKTQNM